MVLACGESYRDVLIHRRKQVLHIINQKEDLQ